MSTQPSDYKALSELGFNLLGPIVGPYLLWLDDEFQRHRPDVVNFIGREGYHLLPLSQYVSEKRQASYAPKRRYLTVSRAFLFKLMLSSPETYHLTLKHPFRGSASDFFRFRYGFSIEQAKKLGLLRSTDDDLVPSIDVARDQELLLRTFHSARAAVEEFVAPRKASYRDYLETGGFSNAKNYFVDIGFSGTIQTLLSILTQSSGHGWYFFKSAGFGNSAPRGISSTGDAYWADNVTFGGGDPLVDWSLVIESVLTAPVGQLIDVVPRRVAEGASSWEFLYGPETRVQQHFHKTYAIADGIRQFIDAMIANGLGHDTVREMLDVRRIYELTLRYDRSAAMRELINLLEIDDGISGLGLVQPFNLLKIGS